MHRGRPLVPARERERLVAAELVQQLPQVDDADVNSARDRPRNSPSQEHCFHVVLRDRQDLHHAARARPRDEAWLVTRLHPGERPHEPRVEAVDACPVREERADSDGVRPADARRERRPSAGEHAHRARSGDPVHLKSPRSLIAAQRPRGRAVEISVHRHQRPAAREQELQDGDVPAEPPGAQRPPAKERAPERPQRVSSPRPGAAVNRNARPPLERLRRRDRLRPGDAVDRAAVEPVCAQRDLKTRDLRVERLRGRRERERRDPSRA